MKSIYKNLFLKFNIGKKMLIFSFANILLLFNFKIVKANEITEYDVLKIPSQISTTDNLFLVDKDEIAKNSNLVIEVEILVNDSIVETKKIKTQFKFFKLDISNYIGKSGVINLKIDDNTQDLKLSTSTKFDLTDLIKPSKLIRSTKEINNSTYSINWSQSRGIDSYKLSIDIYNLSSQLIESRTITTQKNTYLLDLNSFNVAQGELNIRLSNIVDSQEVDSDTVTNQFNILKTTEISDYKAKIKYSSITRAGQGNEFESINEYTESNDDINICIENNDKYWINIDQKRKLYKAYWLLEIIDINKVPNCKSTEFANDADENEPVLQETLGAEVYAQNDREMSTIKSVVKYDSTTFREQSSTSIESNKFKNKGEVVDVCIEDSNKYWIRVSRDENLYKAYWLINTKVEEIPSCYP